MWTDKVNSAPDEAAKCRPRVAHYCVGWGLDIGPGRQKIVESAIGFGHGDAAEVKVDIGDPNSLSMFADRSMDYVFSSHALEDLHDTQGALKRWWRVLKNGGYLVLYLPHKDLYPNVGHKGANPRHKQDFTPEDILGIMHRFAAFDIIGNSTHNEEDEYSFQIVLRKRPGPVGYVEDVRPCQDAPRACVLRYGAYGDALMASIVLPELKRRGYHVTWYAASKGLEVLKHDPRIDEFWDMADGQVLNHELPHFWKGLESEFDLVLNMNGTVEQSMLFDELRDNEYKLSHSERARLAEGNYNDRLLEAIGWTIPDFEKNPLFFPSEAEKIGAARKRMKHSSEFLVGWVLNGTGLHKSWPWSEDACRMFLDSCEEVRVITMGGPECAIQEWEHPRVDRRSRVLGWRDAAAILQVCDAVVGPETGLMHSVSALGNLKVLMLSHSSAENLTKYWSNTVTLEPKEVPCFPCHQLHWTLDGCRTGKVPSGAIMPACTVDMKPEQVVAPLVEAYEKWKEERNAARTGRSVRQYA